MQVVLQPEEPCCPGDPDDNEVNTETMAEERTNGVESLAQDDNVAGVTTMAKPDGEISGAAAAPPTHKTVGNDHQSSAEMSVAEGIKKTATSLKRTGDKKMLAYVASKDGSDAGARAFHDQAELRGRWVTTKWNSRS